MKRQYSRYWGQFNDITRERLRRFKHKLKIKLKTSYLKLLQTASKSNRTKNQKSRKRRKTRKRAQKLDELHQQASKVIVNKTDLVLNDADERLLLLGLSFIPTPKPTVSGMENEWAELNQHIRRVEWDHVCSDNVTSSSETISTENITSTHEEEKIPAKLRFIKHNRPANEKINEETNAYTELCTAQLRNLKPKLMEQFQRRNNLNKELRTSLKKLAEISREGKYIFCRSDKDGKIVIISHEDFQTIMQRELEKDKVNNMEETDMQEKLIGIKSRMEDKVMQLHTDGGISDKMLLHTIGMYKDSDNFVRVKKNAKYFTTGKPGYSQLLFKTHKLSQDEIQTIPAPNIPVRIVSSISNITTSRCTAMLEAILKPVSINYCGSEFTRDSSHYLQSLIEWKQRVLTNEMDPTKIHLIAGDIQSLYPSCSRDLVKKALQQALRQSSYSEKMQELIIDLTMFCMENVLTQFGDSFYSQKQGIITGDNDSVSIANIAMRYVMLSAQQALQFCELAKRFIDDIMLIYFGTLQEAEELKSQLVQAFEKEGLKLIFRHVHAESEQKEVEFLDVNHIIDKDDPAYFITRDFVKPTAIGRVFLNGTSYHPVSTFKSILKGECLRMRRLNERNEDFQSSLVRLKDKAILSNFPKKLTNRIITTASSWSSRFPPDLTTPTSSKEILAWSTAHPSLLKLSERQRELKPSAVVTFKKPANLSTQLIHFRRLCHQSASTGENTPNVHQPACGKCSLCGSWGNYRVNMVYPDSTITNKSTNKTYNINNKLNCRNFGIYAAICTHCPATYVGQTITSFKDRWNAHRNSWKKNIGQTNIDDRNDQAALLKHYLTHHSDVLNKCKNISSAWKVAFVEEPDPANIDRRETHWRDLLEDKTLTVNIQKMVWPRVR